MFFYFDEKADKKPKDVAATIGVSPDKISEWANDLERYGVLKFSKTPYGSLLFKESEIKLLREYGFTKIALGTPRDAIEVIKQSSFIPKEKEDLSWAKELKFAIWRRH